MVNYLAPGVYVQEVRSGVRAIGRVNTSIAAFVGKAPDVRARPDEVVAVDNWTEFSTIFVGDAETGTHLSNAVYGFFSNGGSRCYVVNIGTGESLTGTAQRPTGLTLLEAVDDPAMVAAPGYVGAAAYDALLAHCEHPLRQDRMAIFDTPEHVPDINALLHSAVAPLPDGGTERGSDGGPDGGPDRGEDTDHPEGEPGDTPGGGPGPRTGAAGGDTALGAPQSPDGYAAQYFPWLVIHDAVSGKLMAQPPSGHMAGIWARTDATRGVHKAPANEPIHGTVNLVRQVSRGEQEVLNPAGVNCIRRFPEGFRVWGARTRAPEASEFRYVSTRRLINQIKESIAEGTKWAVFEPNDYTLWASLRRDIRSFLTNVWRDGALLGLTPEQAFFVKCDEETNPPDVREAGQIVTVIGLSVVKPAEFVIFKLMQSPDLTAIETAGA
ncbi:phage tail sheath family protein [Kocuria rhizosphaericola]|uniref:phage tail sheath family protein n=1 Tax=Kocuria rhizosphaericola TaxID=3376284 RepID=UPI00378E0F63